jgi:hypothetical protein
VRSCIVTGAIAYASWTKGVGELIDGKDPFARH